MDKDRHYVTIDQARMAALLESYLASRKCKTLRQQIWETEKRHLLWPIVRRSSYDKYEKNLSRGIEEYAFKTLVYNVEYALNTHPYNPARAQWPVIRAHIIKNNVTDGLLIAVSKRSLIATR